MYVRVCLESSRELGWLAGWLSWPVPALRGGGIINGKRASTAASWSLGAGLMHDRSTNSHGMVCSILRQPRQQQQKTSSETTSVKPPSSFTPREGCSAHNPHVRSLPLPEAQHQIEALVDAVQHSGERVTITDAGRPVAVLLGVEEWESLQETLSRLAQPGVLGDIAEARGAREADASARPEKAH